MVSSESMISQISMNIGKYTKYIHIVSTYNEYEAEINPRNKRLIRYLSES